MFKTYHFTNFVVEWKTIGMHKQTQYNLFCQLNNRVCSKKKFWPSATIFIGININKN